MDRQKDGKGNSSAATRRVTAENAPLTVFGETRKDVPGILAGTPRKDGTAKSGGRRICDGSGNGIVR